MESAEIPGKLAEIPSWLCDELARRTATKSCPEASGLGLRPRPPWLPVRSDDELARLRARSMAGLNGMEWSPAEEARLRSALECIPAIDRDVWLKVGMALHTSGWECARRIWDGWSATCPEKYSEADQERAWASFGRPRAGRPVTLGTLYHLAEQYGWTGNRSPRLKFETNADSGANFPGASERGLSGPQKSADDTATRPLAIDETEILRLSKLGMLEYERERIAAAERLNFRVQFLDRMVAAERDQSDESGKQGRALSLPEPELWPQPVDGAELLSALAVNIRRHVVMFDHAADTAALWALHTHLLDCFSMSPRLAITSPEKGCGKTTALDVMSRLVSRPLPTANASAAAIFRVVELLRPTLLIDEADTFLRENDELRGILNSGHRHGGSVIRTVGEDFEPRSFSTYSACAIALIGRLPATLADRSVPIELRRRRADEPIEAFRFDRTGNLDQLASKAARWAADNADRIRSMDPAMPPGVFNRTADNWRPLLAIADAVGAEWSARARRAVQSVGTAMAAGDNETARVLVLSDIRSTFAERRVDRLSSSQLVNILIGIEGRPWAEWKGGRPITANSLARLLAPFGIAPSSIRTNDGTPKGYMATHFLDAFERYLPKEGIEPPQRHNADGTGTFC